MKIFKGKVVHTKMAKTAVVAVDRFIMHPIYKKRLKRTKKYAVHDEAGVVVGDIVSFKECAPMSKTKRWTIVSVNGKKITGIETKKVKVEVKPKAKPVKAKKTKK